MTTSIVTDFAAIAEAMKTNGNPDAELIRVSHEFAVKHLTDDYRFVIGQEDMDSDVDVASYEWITATPATSAAGWQAKALALSAWNQRAYFNDEDGEAGHENTAGYETLLASLLQDMVAPTRNAIMARIAAQYGPLPANYTPEGRWLGPLTGDDVSAKAQNETPAAPSASEERVQTILVLMHELTEKIANMRSTGPQHQAQPGFGP